MAIAVAVTSKVSVPGVVLVTGTFTASGSYAASGDTVTWAGVAGTSKAPLAVFVSGITGHSYQYDVAAGKLWVYYGDYSASADGPHAEFPAGSYSAGITGDTIRFFAVFPQFG